MSEKRLNEISDSEKKSKKIKKSTKPEEPKPSTSKEQSETSELFNSNESDFDSEEESTKIYMVSELQKDLYNVNKIAINGVVVDAVIISAHDLVKLSLQDKKNHSQTIQVICWNTKFFNFVKIYHEITMYNVFVKSIKEQYLSKITCSSVYEIFIGPESTFKIHGYSNLKSIKFSKFVELKDLPVYKLVNVKGKVLKILEESISKNAFVLVMKGNSITVHLNECFNAKDLIPNSKVLLIGVSLRKFKDQIVFHGNVFSSVFQK